MADATSSAAAAPEPEQQVGQQENEGEQPPTTPFVRLPLESLPATKNDLLLRAARGERTERAPVWMMRQAGRYLPEYMELRVMNDFFRVCRTPELACRVTLQPLERFKTLDALIIFSDILVIPQAMGMEVQMVKGKGPVFPSPIRNPSDMDSLVLAPDVDKQLGYVYDAINLVRQRCEGAVPVIGFCGAPWTLMAYMVEGGGTRTFHNSIPWLYNNPDDSHRLLSALADICIVYLVGQVRAGAQLLQVFDSWGGQLGPRLFREFSLPYLRKIAAGVKEQLAASDGLPDVPMTVFAKGTHWAVEELADSDFDVISLDWTMDPVQCRNILNENHRRSTEPDAKRVRRRKRVAPISLQGNMDPAALYANEQVLRGEVRRMVEQFCDREQGVRGYIANLGWGMQPYMNPDSAGIFIDEVQGHSRQLASESKS